MIWILIVAPLIAAVLVFFLRGSAPPRPYQTGQSPPMHRLGERPNPSVPGTVPIVAAEIFERLQRLSLRDLENFCRKWLATSQMEFKSIDYHGSHEFHILSYFSHPLLRGNVILCGHLAQREEVIDSSVVIGFSDMVKAERAMKGIFITNGYFSEEVMKLNEGASMELIDVSQLAALMKEITPDLLSQPLHVVG